MKEEYILYVLVAIVVGLAIKMFLESDTYTLKCVVSTVDGEKYCVREK